MDRLPYELVTHEILGRLTVQEILEKCRVDQSFYRICQDPFFWSLLVRRDFPQDYSHNPGLPWKDYYIQLYNSPILPIYQYQDPIEWIQLTSHNLPSVIDRVEQLKQRLGIPNHSIVFTDAFNQPVTSDHLMRKIVLIPPGVPIDEFSVMKALTSADPNDPDRPLIYGYVGKAFYLGRRQVRATDEVPGVPCGVYSTLILDRVIEDLGLVDETRRLYWDGNLSDETRCKLILNRLREMGRILNEVAPPQKSLL